MIVSKLMYKTKAKKSKVKNDKDRTLNDCFAATSFSYKRGKGWSELVGSGFVSFHQAEWGPEAKLPRGSRTDCFPYHGWDQQPFKGKVHTGRDWVNLFNGCCRNYLHIGLEEMVSKVASNSRFPMLDTSTSTRGNQSCPLVTKISCSSLRPQDLKKDAEGAKESGIKGFIVQYSLCTEMCAATKQRELRALDSLRRPEFNLTSDNF